MYVPDTLLNQTLYAHATQAQRRRRAVEFSDYSPMELF
jgi:hypothetical protein